MGDSETNRLASARYTEQKHDKKNERKPNELGPDSAGQSGDIQQIPNVADADSESVEELIEEGNAFEADAVYGVENAKDADVSEVTTRQVPGGRCTRRIPGRRGRTRSIAGSSWRHSPG